MENNSTNEIKEEIAELKKRRNAVILSHVYQRDEIQEIADFTGDSFGLSKKAINTDADVILFCGVRFMAETAHILNPEKTVIMPDNNAGCVLADMATVEDVKKMKEKYPDAEIVSYVNSTAAIKSVSDICCTSANAVNVVKSMKNQVIFVPDKNLGRYAANKTERKIGEDIILWEGYCYVHEKNIDTYKIKHLKKEYPDAEIIVHPECNTSVTDLANFIGSTTQMLSYAKNSISKKYIVGTEDGLLFQLRKQNPDKKFYPFNTICRDMKFITLDKVVRALKNMEYKVHITENIRNKAKVALDKMLDVL